LRFEAKLRYESGISGCHDKTGRFGRLHFTYIIGLLAFKSLNKLSDCKTRSETSERMTQKDIDDETGCKRLTVNKVFFSMSMIYEFFFFVSRQSVNNTRQIKNDTRTRNNL